jgi:hypothetical protein
MQAKKVKKNTEETALSCLVLFFVVIMDTLPEWGAESE